MVTVPEAQASVGTLNVALVIPAATVTLVGMVATPASLLESVTIAPPGGAGVLKLTVPVDTAPPRTLGGARLNAESVGGVTVMTALVVPPATVTLAGTMAMAGLLLERATAAPPAGAAELSVTVPVERVPPVTLAGLTLIDDSPGA